MEELSYKLYYGGDIVSMKSRGDYAEAVVTAGSRIVFSGAKKEAEEKYGDALRINLEGKTLMPAFIDAHSHFLQTAQGIDMCDLSEAEDFGQIADMLKKYVREHAVEENAVVFGNGYDHNFLKEKKHPDKKLLDTVSDKIPIYISHVSGHMGVANSALLRLANLAEQEKDPEGGRFGRYDDGSLSGYAEELPAFMQLVAPVMERLETDMAVQIKKAERLYLSNGIATVQEGAGTGAAVKGLAELAKTELPDIDVVAYMLAEEYEETAAGMPEYVGKYVNHVKIGGSKIILDGSPQGRSAWLSAPYEGGTDYCGYPAHSQEYVTAECLKAIRGGYQILAHCNGDAASGQFIEGYQAAWEKAGRPHTDIRPVMIHCQTVRDDQLDSMVRLHMIPSVFVGHVYYWGDIHLENLGKERAGRISPAASALRKGLALNFHQDTPVTKPDMLHSVWCAVNRRTKSGKLLGEEQRIDVYEALKAVTVNAAYAYHEENRKGTIEAGKEADFVILSENPLKAEKDRIKEIKVIRTVKAGRLVYSAD